jgi:putative proteasome-type protease
MTFCLGIRVRNGLIALADTKIVKGEEKLTKSKISLTSSGGRNWWLMTSGLRSVRDKTVTYLEHKLQNDHAPSENLFAIANLFGEQLRRVRAEDELALQGGNLQFNLHAIIGGQLERDATTKMYYIYPEGNWIECNEDSPYFIIGRTHYAKPILDRLLRFDTDIKHAAALAFLGFDATRACVTDVGYPIDMVLHQSPNNLIHQRFEATDLIQVSQWWNQTLSNALQQFPMDCFQRLFSCPNDGSLGSSQSS